MMKTVIFKVILFLSLLINIVLIAVIGIYLYKNKNYKNFNESIRFDKYRAMNKLNGNKTDVVFIGNSIIEYWSSEHSLFLDNNNFTNRGVVGQSSPQILLRFQQDVISLKPKVVVIEAGINDIGEVTGEYDKYFTIDCIKSMCELARLNNIKVILCSVLPAKSFEGKEHITDIPEKVKELNENLSKFARSNHIVYIDYYNLTTGADGYFIEKYTVDGIHPNLAGYDLMEALVLPEIDKLLNK